MTEQKNSNQEEASTGVVLERFVIPEGHPLQILGARLADLLDDDDFNNCETLILDAYHGNNLCTCGKPLPEMNASIEAKLDAGYPCPHATHKRPLNPPVLDPKKFGRQWG